jgi:hypothetical protein
LEKSTEPFEYYAFVLQTSGVCNSGFASLFLGVAETGPESQNAVAHAIKHGKIERREQQQCSTQTV